MSNTFESGAFEEIVRARAYAMWESEGRPNGRDAEHWLRSVEEAQRLHAKKIPDAPKKILDAPKRAPTKSRGKKAARAK